MNNYKYNPMMLVAIVLAGKMLPIFIFCILVISLFSTCSSSLDLNPDGLALLALKAAINGDPTRAFRTWSQSDSTPCHWHGVVCTHNRVTSLFLPNKGLSGYLPSELGLLDSLKSLTISYNNLSHSIPANLFNATNLVFLDLSHNFLSGPIPSQIRILQDLTHLDLSSNLINGSLPDYLLDLRSLSGTLNLSFNHFSGDVPASFGRLPVMLSLDLRHNNLTGRIPQVGSLVSQGPLAFAENPNLCGFPLRVQCPVPQNPTAILNTDNPQNPQDDGFPVKIQKENNGLAIVSFISGGFVVIGFIYISIWAFRRKWSNIEEKTKPRGKEMVAEFTTKVDDSEENGKFVTVDDEFDFDLEDMLRASAYVIGKSRNGIVYSVVVGGRGGSGGTAVAVTRLSEGTTWQLKEFEEEVEIIGRVKHPNIVRLRAYYFAQDERLLISDFICNGSLFSALHGGPANIVPPLSWTARLEIARGTARGLMYIHDYSPRKYTHGCLKSTKILLDSQLQPCISGFGLVRLVSDDNPKIAATSVYVAPEARKIGSKITQKCDVYSFGVVLMEMLMGKVPDGGLPDNNDNEQGNLVRKVLRGDLPVTEIIDPALTQETTYAKNQVVAAFTIALNCMQLHAELRPKMKTVSESLDRIK